MASKILIIGSGFGGLASARRLRAKKFDVTLIENTKIWEVEQEYLKKIILFMMVVPQLLPLLIYLKNYLNCLGKNLKIIPK